MLTQRNQITMNLAAEIAVRSGRKCICTQDYLLACIRLGNPLLKMGMSPAGVSEKAITGFIENARYVDGRLPDRNNPFEQLVLRNPQRSVRTGESIIPVSTEMGRCFRMPSGIEHCIFSTRYLLMKMLGDRRTNACRLMEKHVLNTCRSFMMSAHEKNDSRFEEEMAMERVRYWGKTIEETDCGDDLFTTVTGDRKPGNLYRNEIDGIRMIMKRKRNRRHIVLVGNVDFSYIAERLGEKMVFFDVAQVTEEEREKAVDFMMNEGVCNYPLCISHLSGIDAYADRIMSGMNEDKGRLVIVMAAQDEWDRSRMKSVYGDRFEAVRVRESDLEDLSGVEDVKPLVRKRVFEIEHDYDVKFSSMFINEVAKIAYWYYPERPLPGSAFDLMEDAAAYVSERPDDRIVRNDDMAKVVMIQKGMDIYNPNADKEEKGEGRMNRMKQPVPVMSVMPDGLRPDSIQKTIEDIRRRVIGQNRAVRTVSDALERVAYGLRDSSRPLGVYCFLGPTGVGKTELAKAIADSAFDGNMIRLDMSEYNTRWTAARLLGAEPGYKGYEDTETLVDKVNKKPYTVILIDEIEKSYPTIYDLFLQVFDDGRLTDGCGNTGDFSHTLIIMTSNLGFTGSDRAAKISGFGAEMSIDEANEQRINDAVKRFFRPEFLNRMDERIIFESLKMDDAVQIAGKMIEAEQKRIRRSSAAADLEVDMLAQRYLAAKYHDEENGARPLRRGIETEIEGMVIEGRKSGRIKEDSLVSFTVDHGRLVYSTKKVRKPELKPLDNFGKRAEDYSDEDLPF